MTAVTRTGAVFAIALKWHEGSDHAADGVPFGGHVCNCERVAERVMPMLATAFDQGAGARCPDPDRCWCSDFVHTPNQPVTPNPYRAQERAQ